MLLRARRDETGQAGVEYGLIIAIVAVSAVVGVLVLGGGIDGLFDKVSFNGGAQESSGQPGGGPAPPGDGTELSGNGMPSGTVWFNAGIVTQNGNPGPPGAYSNSAPTDSSCSFAADGFEFRGDWTEQTFVGPGGTTYRYACLTPAP